MSVAQTSMNRTMPKMLPVQIRGLEGPKSTENDADAMHCASPYDMPIPVHVQAAQL